VPFTRRQPPLFIGVIHLPPLPGAPRPGPGLDAALRRAEADARALAQGGADAVIVENFGDAPFAAERVEAVTVAAMTAALLAVRVAAPDLQLGVNVLRNDALAALGVAAVVGAAFVRVNVLSGVMVTDQGLISGCARDLMLARTRYGAGIDVAADVLVKHAAPLGAWSIADAARDTWHRGGADALIVTGHGTGLPVDPGDLRAVREAAPEAPLWIGSGLTLETAPALRAHIDGAIVGTALHEGGRWALPLDVERVRRMGEALRG
jgi:membrane complex biogenesis BtpA family protein